MNEQNTKKLIEKHKYMFAEMDRSREIQIKQAKITDEFVKAKANEDEIKIAQIMEEQREIGAFYPIAFGFECGDGWYELLDNLMDEIQKIDIDKSVSVHQVKEKFGGLRFYIGSGNDEVYRLIGEAEDKSYKICEVCGKPGKTNKSGWLRTSCEEHTRK